MNVACESLHEQAMKSTKTMKMAVIRTLGRTRITLDKLKFVCKIGWRVAHTSNEINTSGAPFMRAHRMSGHSR